GPHQSLGRRKAGSTRAPPGYGSTRHRACQEIGLPGCNQEGTIKQYRAAAAVVATAEAAAVATVRQAHRQLWPLLVASKQGEDVFYLLFYHLQPPGGSVVQ